LVVGARKGVVIARPNSGCSVCLDKEHFHTELQLETPLICQSFWHWRYSWADCLSNATTFRKQLRERLCQLCEVPAPGSPQARRQGVVFTGRVHHLELIQTSIRMLRHLQYHGEIEVFLSQKEDVLVCENRLLVLKVQCKLFASSFRVGFSSKIGAILQSSFDDVLFIDADNVLILSPDLLFQDKNFLREGVLLWADFWGNQCRKHPWNVANDNPEGVMLCGQTAWPDHVAWPTVDLVWQPFRAYSQEITSSQVLIDRHRHRDALELALFMTESRFMQNVLYGDKDTFRLGLLMTNNGMYMVDEMPGQISDNDKRLYVMSWFNGRPMTIDQVKGGLGETDKLQVLLPLLNDFCYSSETESYCAPDYGSTPPAHFFTNASVTKMVRSFLRTISGLQGA